MNSEYQKRKKKRNRRLLLAILMVLGSGIILSTSTYAWFTANRTVKVNDITVNVSAVNGLQISVDGLNWKTIISNDDILNAHDTYASAVNQLPLYSGGSDTSIAPTSTIGEIDASTGFMKMFTGSISSDETGNYTLFANRSSEADGQEGNFVAFDLFLMTNTQLPIYLTSNSNVTASGTSTGIENAARIGLVYQGITEIGSSTAAIQGLKQEDATFVPFIWELNNDVHTAAAVNNAKGVYNIDTTLTGASQITYKGVKAEIPETANIPLNSTDTNYFGDMPATMISTPKAGIPTTAYQSYMTLEPGITKIRVYMWIEGQDVDCENNASGGSLTYSLQFSANDKAA